MRLWGRVASGMSLAIGAVFAVVAIAVPETRPASAVAAVLMAAVGLLGVPALVRLFSAFTGDEEVLQHGKPGSGIIRAIEPTRWHYNRRDPIVRFRLDVELEGVTYPVQITQAVDPERLARLGPGVVVAVRADRADRKRVVIDWREDTRPPAEATEEGAKPGAPGVVVARPARRSPWPLLRWLLLLFGLIFLRLGCEEGYYQTGGVGVDGVVVEKSYSPGTSSTGRTPSSPSRYHVRYRFTTKEGRTLEGRYDVLPGAWRKLQEGGPVVVEYLPDSPDTNRIPGQRAGSTTWTVMALVLLAASAVLFVIGRRTRPTRGP